MSYQIKTIHTDMEIQRFYTLALSCTREKALENYQNLLFEIILKKENIVLERFYGDLKYKKDIKLIRQKMLQRYSFPAYPVSYIQGASVNGQPFSGVVIHTVETCKNNFLHIHENDLPYGSVYNLSLIHILLPLHLRRQRNSELLSSVQNMFRLNPF